MAGLAIVAVLAIGIIRSVTGTADIRSDKPEPISAPAAVPVAAQVVASAPVRARVEDDRPLIPSLDSDTYCEADPPRWRVGGFRGDPRDIEVCKKAEYSSEKALLYETTFGEHKPSRDDVDACLRGSPNSYTGLGECLYPLPSDKAEPGHK